MFTNRWTYAIVLLTGVIAWGILAAMTPSSCSGVTKLHFDVIENGMTRADVEALFGKAPEADFADAGGLHRWASWRSDDGAASADIVFFEDKVIDKGWIESNQNIFARIRRWLSLPQK